MFGTYATSNSFTYSYKVHVSMYVCNQQAVFVQADIAKACGLEPLCRWLLTSCVCYVIVRISEVARTVETSDTAVVNAANRLQNTTTNCMHLKHIHISTRDTPLRSVFDDNLILIKYYKVKVKINV